MSLRKAVFLCWLVPLICGLLVFVVWVFTRWDILPFIGIYTIYAGLAATVLGLLCLAIDLKCTWNKTSPRWQYLIRPKLKWLMLLLMNFPIALAIFLMAIYLETTFFITVKNASASTLERVFIRGPSVSRELGTIKPGRKAKTSFQVFGDGELEFEVISKNQKPKGIIEHYVTHGMGGSKVLEIKENGEFSVKN